jgi:hypothetical protein
MIASLQDIDTIGADAINDAMFLSQACLFIGSYDRRIFCTAPANADDLTVFRNHFLDGDAKSLRDWLAASVVYHHC